MCTTTCARLLGPCLLTLGLLSIFANLLLLFPSWESHYLILRQITEKAMLLPGLWGGGLLVFPAAIQITSIGWGWSCSRSSGNCQKMFLTTVLSALALLGSAACFIMSGVGLAEGPYCLYVAIHNQVKTEQWGYPFREMDNQALDDGRIKNYLYDPTLWKSVCIEPQNIVAWNVYFFSALLIISMVEMVLSVLQIINGFFGCICGFCEKK
uniref:Transmembrane 4 L6 family member 19 n=1 Tax=Pogona vitticeps TaxID=103695 RepID=A0A6J0T469_9SAUR